MNVRSPHGPASRVDCNTGRIGRETSSIAKAKDRGVKFGRKRELTDDKVAEIKKLRKGGMPDIMRQTKFSKASVYRALGSEA